jgi:hypothetical protein
VLKNKHDLTFQQKFNTIGAYFLKEQTMERQRFVETGRDSFFGDYLYNQVVPQEHFLRKMKQGIDWERFTRKLIRLYKGEGIVGRPPFDPALVLKVELIAYLYNITERQVEAYINENLPAKYFVGRSESPGSLDADCFPRAAVAARKDESVSGTIRGNSTDCARKWDQVWLNPDRG